MPLMRALAIFSNMWMYARQGLALTWPNHRKGTEFEFWIVFLVGASAAGLAPQLPSRYLWGEGCCIPLPTRVDNMGGVYPYLDNFYPDKHGLDNMTPHTLFFNIFYCKGQHFWGKNHFAKWCPQYDVIQGHLPG